MAWTVLRLTPKPDCENAIKLAVLDRCEAIEDIVHKADPSLCPIHFAYAFMVEAALEQRVESQLHTLLIHPDLSIGDGLIFAGMTDRQAVHFKLAHSDDYDIEPLKDRPDGEA
jgi:hypothetical protein